MMTCTNLGAYYMQVPFVSTCMHVARMFHVTCMDLGRFPCMSHDMHITCVKQGLKQATEKLKIAFLICVHIRTCTHIDLGGMGSAYI